jgi:ABC-type bacteriocin/lantibiotic exporter with double-glycine peptidase domain
MKNPYQRFWELLKPDKKEIYQVYTYAIFKGIIALSLPLGIQSIINLIQAGRVSTSWVVLIGVVTFGIAMGGYMQIMQMRIMETIQQKIFTRAAFDFTYRIPKISFSKINKYYAPELVNRFFDIVTLQKSVAKIIIDFSTGILQIVFGLILLSLYHSFFILFSVLLILLIYIIIKLTSKKGMQTSLQESKYKFQVVSWLEELARSKDSFKLAGETHLPQSKTDERVTGYLNSRESHFQVMKTQYFLLLTFKILVALGLLLIGGLLVLNQKMNIGQFVAAEIIILLVIDSAEKLILNLENIFDTLTSLEKIGEVFDMELDNHNQSTLANENIQGAIKVELNSVEFTYPGRNENVLRGINFEFKPNYNYCISGNNGSGKSTLIHLISGLYQPQKGTVCLNGLPLGNYNIPELYKIIGNGLNEETIFEGTFYENITLGRDFVASADVFWALDKLLLSDYIKTLPNGLDTRIDISGHKLSKSVIQKIIIARSVVNHPKLLLLESHLDSIEDLERKKIIDFLTDKNNGWTFIAISNDSYLKQKSDSVIKMEAGEIFLK